MLDKILNILKNEDTYSFFTGNTHPSVSDAVSAISNPEDYKEIERALKNYFDQVMQISTNESPLFIEANRMYSICDGFFSSCTNTPINNSSKPEATDLNEEIVNFYLDSLKHFASFVNEDILNAHIAYIEDSN